MAGKKDLNEEGQEMMVTPILDGDTGVECVVLTISNAGEHEYIVLLPMEDADSEEGKVYLYRYSETEDGTPNLGNVGDDGEYEIVAEIFGELPDTQGYDKLMGEVEEE